MPPAPLETVAAGITFQNPLLLAAGTAGYGREVAQVLDLDALGGIVTKAVSVTPRSGAPAPRVAEFDGGMINAVGLANPGMDEVRGKDLPWLEQNVRRARVIVNIVGNTTDEFAAVIRKLDDSAAISAYELNVSCPNVRAGGMEFGADAKSLTEVVSGARGATRKPLFVKLSPALPDIARTARVAADAGADGITVVNTMPGLVVDVESRRPALGFGSGGVSGSGLLPVGVLAAYKVAREISVPVIGAGGISRATDIVQYVLAGATLVAVGTSVMQDPKLPARLIADLRRWLTEHGVASIGELRGALEWAH
ncbi:MAG TPA: dihydroorotate dehydrogenase [Gemmatimonadaceae bacterium]|nr:dihydroorotate dehydrogenase [Gemmatimonadaceae bacterium]